jgi:hypothetical protein
MEGVYFHSSRVPRGKRQSSYCFTHFFGFGGTDNAGDPTRLSEPGVIGVEGDRSNVVGQLAFSLDLNKRSNLEDTSLETEVEQKGQLQYL